MSKGKTRLDEACIRVAMTTAANLFNSRGSPLDAVVVVPVWRNEGEIGFEYAPAMMGDPDALPGLANVLREVADRIDAGEFMTVEATKSGPVGQA